MKDTKHMELSESEESHVRTIQRIEEQLFPDDLYPNCIEDMKVRDGREYSYFRPSHHFRTRLVTKEDVDLLRHPNTRLLSIGANPPYLERTLMHLGVHANNITIADIDPNLLSQDIPCKKVVFDINTRWPNIGTFDRIIFPESLGVSTSVYDQDYSHEKQNILNDDNFPEVASLAKQLSDVKKIHKLTKVMTEVRKRLRPNGIMRANGPIAYPHVIGAVKNALELQNIFLAVQQCRLYFLSVIQSDTPVPNAMLETFYQHYVKIFSDA